MDNFNVTQEQTGGWFVATILLVEDVLFCPTILTNANSNQIIIVPKYPNLDILPVRESIKINATPRNNNSGTSYTIKAEFEITSQNKDIDTYLNSCVTKKVMLIAQKHYGQQILYGSKKCPLKFSYKAINGTKYEDGSLFKLYVEGSIPQKPVFL